MSKLFYYNTRKMYIDESIRLKPIRAYYYNDKNEEK